MFTTVLINFFRLVALVLCKLLFSLENFRLWMVEANSKAGRGRRNKKLQQYPYKCKRTVRQGIGL
jgi:hypothetical protein